MRQLSLIILFINVLCSPLLAQTYTPVDDKSKIAFIARNMGSDVPGTLTGLKGKIEFNPKKIQSSSFNVSVEVATINTNNKKRDDHLKKDDFFDLNKFATISIVSTKLYSKGGNKFFAKANLTMHGVTKEVLFDFTADPTADGYLLKGGFPINRLDYGVGSKSMILEDKVNISLYVVAKK